MMVGRTRRALCALVVSVGLVAVQVATADAAARHGQYMLRAKTPAAMKALRAKVERAGGHVVRVIYGLNILVVQSSRGTRIRSLAHAAGASFSIDHVEQIIDPESAGATPAHRVIPAAADFLSTFAADPANAFAGLMWNLDRIGAPKAWKTTTGSDAVTVGVADTGLDFTHSELAGKVASVVDLTDPTLCSTYFGASDADFAALYGGPASTDWNGHGSWIGGNIAANSDGVGINGIAPNIKLVALKISEWCGSAYDSSLIASFKYAADHGIDVVSISFGGYLDRSDPAQDAIYKAYVDVVRYARARGTVIVAAAGNEHTRIGAGGKVLSHGTLTIPGDPVADYYGYYEVPGGIPGVVDVAATGNVVVGSSPTCAAGTTGGNATCKPASDLHQPTGVGRRDQLTYYSNYGPRIDIAAPGGAREFNVPSADRGGTPGWPYTDASGTTAFEDFSITSNWALEIPCFVLPAPFYTNDCYTAIQGTSMATPHVSAAIALAASANREARKHPETLIDMVLRSAREAHNTTPPLSATDTSAGDRTGLACPTGYCHLGGHAVSDKEAYGAGVLDVGNAVGGR